MNESINTCMDYLPPDDGFLYCPANLDYFNTCWNYTRAGTEISTPCPAIFKSDAFAIRRCEDNGRWFVHPEENKTWINFNACIIDVPSVKLVYLYFAGYSLSIICLVISLIIFYFFRQLQCDRVILHKNLFFCYLINAIMWLIFYSVVPNVNVMVGNSVYCQLLFIVVTYFSVGTYTWIFSEGLYLAVILIVTFHNGSALLIICLVIGWGFPFIVTFAYSVTRYLVERPKECWMTKSYLDLILTIPNIIALSANLIIILFILKILITKLRHPSSREEAQWRKTAKAVFILIPLFGIQNIIFSIRSENSTVSVVQDYITGITTSFQGVLVSFILCFFNGEVKNIMRRRSSQHRILQPLKNSRRETYTSDVLAPSQPRRSVGMRAVSVRSSVVSVKC